MREVLRGLLGRLERVNINTIASISIIIVLIGLAALLFRFSGSALGEALQQDIEAFLTSARGTIWAPFAVIIVFSGLGLTGFPQFMLIGMTAVIFGPWAGFAYSWIATMVSSTVGFTLGRTFGSDALKRFGGETVNDVSRRISEYGLVSSMLVRIIPSAPFIVVNMIAGVAKIPFWKFGVGTGIGIVPKAAVIAFLSGNLLGFLQSQDPKDIIILLAVLAAWIAIGYWVKRKYSAARPVPSAPEESQSGQPRTLTPGSASTSSPK